MADSRGPLLDAPREGIRMLQLRRRYPTLAEFPTGMAETQMEIRLLRAQIQRDLKQGSATGEPPGAEHGRRLQSLALLQQNLELEAAFLSFGMIQVDVDKIHSIAASIRMPPNHSSSPDRYMKTQPQIVPWIAGQSPAFQRIAMDLAKLVQEMEQLPTHVPVDEEADD